MTGPKKPPVGRTLGMIQKVSKPEERHEDVYIGAYTECGDVTNVTVILCVRKDPFS